MALALSVLGDRFRSMLDVTIVYPQGAPNFWQFLCGRMPKVIVRVRKVEIPREFGTGDYATDPRFRKTIQRWLIGIWRDKDREIDALLGRPRPADGERAGGAGAAALSAAAPADSPGAGRAGH